MKQDFSTVQFAGHTPAQILEFESRTFVHEGAKREAVRREFKCTLTRYTQVLYLLLDRHELELRQIDPTMTRLLIERRARHTAARAQLAGTPTPTD